MKSLLSALLLSVVLAAPVAVAQVVGSPWGFATGVTGGGNAKPAYPKTNAELVALLGSSQPQVVGTEGTTTAEDGRAPWGRAAGCPGSPSTPTAGAAPASSAARGFTSPACPTSSYKMLKIANLNPKSVWGGDALTFFGSDLVWIDRTSKIGRQHYVTGFGGNKRHTWSNNCIDGKSDFSTSCDGRHYWGILVSGDGDEITFQ
ncbi:putative pectin lyase C, partial [Colletotrichum shisoi]